MSTVLYLLHDPSPRAPPAIRDGFAFTEQSRSRLLAGSSNRPPLRPQRRCLIDLTDWFIGAVAIAGSSADAQIPIAI
jgi:hypothetical protein